MEHQYPSKVGTTITSGRNSTSPPLPKLSLVTEMGSNNPAYPPKCNGNQQGVIVSAKVNGKKGTRIKASTVVSEEEELSSQQNSRGSNSSTASIPPSSSSSSLQSSSANTNPNDVVEVMDTAVNGHDENCCSMDQHPSGGRNLVRPEPRSAAAQIQQPHHPLLQQLHHPSIPHQLPQYHTPFQSTVTGGTTMGRLYVDSEYLVENQLYPGPGSVNIPPVLAHHPHSIPPGEHIVSPESPPPPPYVEQGKTFGRKRSRKRQKTCGVCGDRAKSFHFGGLSCDSCKAFFRRSVQNDAHVAFRCAYDSCCDINISTRKSCQFCRFQKCILIGMEKSWVMTEEERNHLNQQRLEKKQNKPAQQQQSKSSSSATPTLSVPQGVGGGIVSPSSTATAPSEPRYTFQGSAKSSSSGSKEPTALAFQESEYVADVDKMLDYMTYEDQLEIKSVVETYLHAYKEMPFRVSFEEGRRDTLEIIEMFTTILRRFAYFAKQIPDFALLNKGDQGNLLRAAVLEMCLLRGAACFDTENNRWPSSTMESLKDCPQLRVEDMQRLVSRELFEMHITFIFHMKRLRIDEPIAMLLIMTVLFSPERIPVENKVKINQAQEKYLMLLKKYVTWKFGSGAGSRVYPQLLTKLSDLRQLNDFHTEFHLNLDRKEVNAIKLSLTNLNLNPYPNWKIVPESRSSSPDPPSEPVLPAPSPLAEGGRKITPMVTQALIQSFADRRLPTLLENPYATFETDMGMIRQVQQTLGSLFPAGLSPAFTSNTQPLQQRHPSTDSESTSLRNYPQHDPMLSSDKSLTYSRPSSNSPRGYSSSTDSAEGQGQGSGFEILHSSASRQRDYQAPPLRPVAEGASGSSASATSSSSHLDNPISSSSIISSDYHSERVQQFLQQRRISSPAIISGGVETESVIRTIVPSASGTFPQTSTLLSRSQPIQTVLRKHSSSGSSLPVAPSSVIRSTSHLSRSSIDLSSTTRASAQSPDSASRSGTSVIELRDNPGPISFRQISCPTTPSAGWHGGEVRTTTNGQRQASAGSAITVTTRIQAPPHPPHYREDKDEDSL